MPYNSISNCCAIMKREICKLFLKFVKCLLFNELKYITVLFHYYFSLRILNAVDFNKNHLGKNYRIKTCRIRLSFQRKKCFFVCKQLFFCATTGSSPTTYAWISERNNPIMMIPICFVKRENSCLYSICLKNMHSKYVMYLWWIHTTYLNVL